MTSQQRSALPNRQTQFSDTFRQFICTDWEPYDTTLPAPLPGAAAAAAHRRQLSRRYPGERLIIPAGGLKVRNNDCDYRFRPHTAFTWLTGLGTDREPDAVLVMEPAAGGHEATLYFHPRVPRTDQEFYADTRYGEMWVGQRESLAEMAALGQLRTADIAELEPALQSMASQTPTRMLRETHPQLAAKLDAWRGRAERQDAELVVALSELRLIKDAYELEQLRQACRATAVGFEAVARALPTAVAVGRGERWVEGIFALHARHQGNAVGYDTIAASGDHANTLHWIRNDGELRPGDLLLLDAGVELDSLFTADVTRTLPVSGRFSPAQRQVYDAVYAAQRAGIAAAKPGAKFSDVHQAAITVLVDHLAEWGLLPVSAAESMTGGQYRRWMVHGTSHHLGLDVHDCAQARSENYRDGVLAPGMVITVEPGLYFKSTDLLVPQELRGIGVRIEDDIAITEDGCEVLSDQLPTAADEVEAWLHGLMGS